MNKKFAMFSIAAALAVSACCGPATNEEVVEDTANVEVVEEENTE